MCQEFQRCADISVFHKQWNLKGMRGGMWCVVQLELERVIGLTTTSPNGLACNTSTGDLAYLAGCVVVVYNVKANCQTRFLMASKTPKAFACVTYSNQGGKFLAAGEVIIIQKILYFTACSTKCFFSFFFPFSLLFLVMKQQWIFFFSDCSQGTNQRSLSGRFQQEHVLLK
jgi:hypothetical protein